MLTVFNRKLKRFCSRLGWPIRRRSKQKIVIKKFGKSNSRTRNDANTSNTTGSAVIHPSNESSGLKSKKPICVATFNAALFSMAPAVPEMEKSASYERGNEGSLMKKNGFEYDLRTRSMNDRPKSILKQSPLRSDSMDSSENLSKQQKFAKSRLRVSINLPDNEISLKKIGQSGFSEAEKEASSRGSSISRILKGKAPLTHSKSTSFSAINGADYHSFRSTRTVLDVLRELNADILALQDVKAEEEKEMKPLSDLAKALGMNYVFAESWAPEYGNAILSKWPIKKWRAQKIFDETDFRNVLKATIDVPQVGEIDFFCTHLDHLDENWRMKQMNAIIQSTNIPYILAGGLNSLDETDYSQERWTDIVKYYEEMGKPTPKLEVMKYLKSEHYTDSKDFAGECESVVMIAKGQNVQGTCKYGTRVDYILSSPNAAYKFVPGSYSVFSSKGTSDHHIVKVDLMKVDSNPQQQYAQRRRRQSKQRIVKITHSSSSPSKGIWKAQS